MNDKEKACLEFCEGFEIVKRHNGEDLWEIRVKSAYQKRLHPLGLFNDREKAIKTFYAYLIEKGYVVPQPTLDTRLDTGEST